VKVCFVTAADASATPAALAAHARVLAAGPDVEAVTIAAPDAVKAGPVDVAVAAGWRSVAALFELDARRRVLYVAGLEHEALPPEHPDRLLAALPFDLPLDYVAEGQALAAAVRELRPRARVLAVDPGRPPEAPAPPAGGDVRVFFGEGAGALAEPVAGARTVAVAAQADVVVTGRAAEALAALARGSVVVATPFDGAEDLLRHGENAVLVTDDDPRGLASWLARLAGEPGLLDRLRAGARSTAAAWPTEDEAAAAFAAALRELLEAEPPADPGWPALILGDARAHGLAVRQAIEERDEALHGTQAELERLRAGAGATGEAMRARIRATSSRSSRTLSRLRAMLRRRR
jgi:hypothetical protein